MPSMRSCGDPGLAQLAFFMEMDDDDTGAVGCYAQATVRGHSQIDTRELHADPAKPACSVAFMAMPQRILDAGGCPYLQTAATATVFASDASALQLVVGLAAPFRMHAATSAFLDMFQLSAATCIGRSIGLVHGPETNVKLLHSLFETVRVGKEANAMLMFYPSSCKGNLFRVSIEPQSASKDKTECCIVSLELVRATPLQDALLPDGRAKVIVSAESQTVYASPEFETLYGYLWSEIAGRTLGFITGPNTNTALLHKLLKSARDGHSSTHTFFTNTRRGDELLTVIEVKPLVEGGLVSHMLLVCSIAEDIDGHCRHAQATNDSDASECGPATGPLARERYVQACELQTCGQYASQPLQRAQQATVQEVQDQVAPNGPHPRHTSPYFYEEIAWAKTDFKSALHEQKHNARTGIDRSNVRERELALMRTLVRQRASGVHFSGELGRLFLGSAHYLNK